MYLFYLLFRIKFLFACIVKPLFSEPLNFFFSSNMIHLVSCLPIFPENAFTSNQAFSFLKVFLGSDVWRKGFTRIVEAFDLAFDFDWVVIHDVKLLSCQNRECFHAIFRDTIYFFFESKSNFYSIWINNKCSFKVMNDLIFDILASFSSTC